MTRTEFDIFHSTGTLGRCVRSYQKTFKRKKRETAWRQVIVTGGPRMGIRLSFDGGIYHDLMMIESSTLVIHGAARAVRLDVPRSPERSLYSIMCRE